MAEWINAVKIVHSIAVGITLSFLLSLAIQANVSFSSSTCDKNGLNLETGSTQCKYTDQRIWVLVLFYSGAFVFFIGSIANCQNNGYVVIFSVLMLLGWLGFLIQQTLAQPDPKNASIDESLDSLTAEVIRDNWGFWATFLHWLFAITIPTSLIAGVTMSIYFVINDKL